MELNKQERTPLYYTNEELDVIGQITTYEIDIDINDKCDFELSCYDGNLTEGCAWFIPGTPYGGFIDERHSQNENGQYKYSGPSLQGYLNNIKITDTTGVYHANNHDRTIRVTLGNLRTYINTVLRETGTTNSHILYECRYNYDLDLMQSLNVDLGIGVWDALKQFMNMCQVTADFTVLDKTDLNNGHAETLNEFHNNWLIDIYFDLPTLWEDKEYNFPQDGDLKITDYGESINHLICLGENHHNEDVTIHLFWDEDGELQPYARVAEPLHDADYYKSNENQVLFGLEERSDVVKMSSSYVEAYEPLTRVPEDWRQNYTNYYEYKMDETGELTYQQLKPLSPNSAYKVLTSKPDDWDVNWQAYYTRKLQNGVYKYSPVENVETFNWINVSYKPRDWEYTYSNYYKKIWDGTQYIYEQYQTQHEEYYEMQTRRPTRWSGSGGSQSYGDFYMLRQDEGDDKPVMHQVDKLYSWVPGKFYTKYTRDYAPDFVGALNYTYYKGETITSAPTWQTNTYYELKETVQIPKFLGHTYYKKVYYNYPKLVKAGLDYYKTLKRGYVPEATIIDDDIRINDIVILKNPFDNSEIYCKAKNIIAKIKSGTIVTEVTVGV